jgi:hypothetical protein
MALLFQPGIAGGYPGVQISIRLGSGKPTENGCANDRYNRYPPAACRTPMLRFVTKAIVDDTKYHRAAYRSTLFPSGSFTEA